MDKISFDKRTLKKFAIIMGMAFLLITMLALFRHRHINLSFAMISASFFVIAFTVPSILKPFYFIWMRLAFVLSWINTRLILIIMFYLVFAPIGFVIRLVGKDLLERKIEKNSISYWQRKDKSNSGKINYERQF